MYEKFVIYHSTITNFLIYSFIIFCKNTNIEFLKFIENSKTCRFSMGMESRMYTESDHSKFTTETPLVQMECLNGSAEFIQTTEVGGNLFMSHVCKLKSAFNLCCNSEEKTFEGQEDIKAKLKMDLTLFLTRQGYPPETNDEVFKKIFEQAENFKKYS